MISQEEIDVMIGNLKDDVAKPLKSGIVLPKGHGRLFDERDIVNGKYKVIGNRIYECEPALEADKENRT